MEHLFVADTNLFFEAKRLEDLPWADLGVDPVVIGLTKPVQAEIDRHKKGTGRTRKRALETFKRVRAMLQSSQTEAVIREADPRVVLRLMTAARPDSKLSDTLDFNTVDDVIVGIVSELSKNGEYASVKIMTDDGGVGMTAAGLGVAFHLIDDTWKRPPAPSDKDRQIEDLQKDLAAYRVQEPIIELVNDTETTSSPHVVRRIPNALTHDQIDTLMGRLEKEHPRKTDFAVPETVVQKDGTEISYIPPSPEKVEAYADSAYPNWLSECRDRLETLAEGREEKEPPVTVRFAMRNVGTRPASKVRVTFETQGDVFIIRRSRDGDKDTGEAPSPTPSVHSLSKPPVPPQAERIVKRPPQPQPGRTTDLASLSQGMTGGIRATDLGLNIPGSALRDLSLASSIFSNLDKSGVLGILADQHSGIGSALALQRENERLLGLSAPASFSTFGTPGQSVFLDTITHRPPHLPKHDPEGFYFDDWPMDLPVRAGSFICDLFRHQSDLELFDVEILFPKDGNVTGAILCRVQAENLTKPIDLRIPVSRTIEDFDLLEIAGNMIDALGK